MTGWLQLDHGGAQETRVFKKVALPRHCLHGVPLRVRLFEGSLTGGEPMVVGQWQAPIANFLPGVVERPRAHPVPLFVHCGDLQDEKKEEKKAAASEVELDLGGWRDAMKRSLDLIVCAV